MWCATWLVELVPGGGWYTKLLAPTVAENGEYHAALGTTRIKERLADKAGFEEMNIHEGGRFNRPEGSRFYNVEGPESGLGVEKAIFQAKQWRPVLS